MQQPGLKVVSKWEKIITSSGRTHFVQTALMHCDINCNMSLFFLMLCTLAYFLLNLANVLLILFCF